MFYVYLLRCKDDSLYCGYTSDLKKRVETHNKGMGGKYTRSHRPVELVYFEKYKTRILALRREYEIKQFSRSKKFSLLEKNINQEI